MAWLYVADDLDAALGVGDRASLTGEEARHAASVARVRVGERITISDGRGLGVSGPVAAADRDRVTITVETIVRDEPARRTLRLVQALAKGGRDELAIQSATELGVDEIVPWQAARSVSRWDAAKRGKALARWRGIVREAAKQSIRLTIPTVLEPVDTAHLADDCADERADDLVLVLVPGADRELPAVLAESTAREARRLTLVVGPEGGIDEREVSALVGAGAVPVSLGSRVLRTSTAGAAALAVVWGVRRLLDGIDPGPGASGTGRIDA
ncbi:16S rRNA (uracil(1498)-N(3))-methyltransferase [Pseudoclavibacter chungangensis]|uniref:Ribosomal RNA small subunit methyltransferase E n=1 Tax=Pseudoclavibacter chungangensis TaxID=587635 RepID=A0A7J5BSH7_9MICO|nr:16S rRNA (uracil(1498)-N(3))-methyltransferase [Pseudoclavibacter chungangensis]KAB1657270.1 16S rRNA (uracil(1498)-N(3))-methyltransferase [Pseudoclavibacter chungangensis]NYJ66284.1 16S rRNA (uracil1498-N3)-methyltransferase [Pseudoclavibacter chungangensis]